MIDLHSHILPELDDGPQDLYQALEMARLAVESGVTAMVATPHCADDRTDEIRSMLRLLRAALQESRVPLRIYSGMEIYGTGNTARLLTEGKLLTLNRSRYPLIEFDFRSDGHRQTQILSQVIQAGFVPIVAHPERYAWVQYAPEILNRWVQMGCVLQINKGSLLGRFGPVEQELSMELVSRGFAGMVASDAHGISQRTPWMYEVRLLLEQEFGLKTAKELLLNNPGHILKNEMIRSETPDWF